MAIIDDITEIAVAVAHAAGKILLENRGSVLGVDAALQSDLKLEMDRLCEKAMVDVIRSRYPRHSILSEEMGFADGDEYIWYIDPLDGTVNYYYGLPYFCTTIACYRRAGKNTGGPDNLGEPLAGVTYAPLTGEMFVAMAGGGLTLNGEQVHVREEASLEECLFITSIGNDAAVLDFTREVTLALSKHVRKTRNMGARAYDLANVACGHASGFFEYGVKAWDIAAGKIQIEEAGGKMSVWRAGNGAWTGAASGITIHEQLLELLVYPQRGS